ncbi:MAG: response regulator [Pseudomonadota bacterium]
MKTRVLTIDDSKTMLDMLHAALDSEGFEVLQAKNGQEGIDVLSSETVDVIITDVNMPVMDGITFIREARKDDRLRALPILILTTETSAEKRQMGRDAGGTGWIVKPFNTEQLVKVIRKVVH